MSALSDVTEILFCFSSSDHVKSALVLTPIAGRAFIEQVIFPKLPRAEQLVAEKRILCGVPVAGHVALRFIMEADSLRRRS